MRFRFQGTSASVASPSRRCAASVCCWCLAPSSGKNTEQQLSGWKGGGAKVQYLIGKLWIFHAGDVSDSGHMRCCLQRLKTFRLFPALKQPTEGKPTVFCLGCATHSKLLRCGVVKQKVDRVNYIICCHLKPFWSWSHNKLSTTLK